MLTLVFGLGLTAALLAGSGYRVRHPAPLGVMSQQWVAAWQASQPAASQ